MTPTSMALWSRGGAFEKSPPRVGICAASTSVCLLRYLIS
jgi:hypothetical protein